MKLKRLLVLFCMIVSCVCLSVAFAACGETAHTHLDAQWSGDATKHWKVCPECNQKYDEANHSFTDGTCTVCGRSESGEENPGTDADIQPVEGNPNCEHDWQGGWKVAKDKTCTEDGAQTRTCSICGRREVRAIKCTGHVIVKHAGQPATCLEGGYEDYEMCTQCDYNTRVDSPALGHDYVPQEGQAATCTETGWTAYKTCSRCDYDSREDASVPDDHYIDLLPHEYESDDPEAQCKMCHKTRFIASDGLEIVIAGSVARVVSIGTCTDKIVSIPEEYEGRPVTDICESAFSPNKPSDYYNSWDEAKQQDFDRKVELLNQITEIKMRGIKLIDKSAFAFMSALTTVDLGSSLQRINTMAFSACYALKEVTIPKTCSVIESQAFFHSDALRSLKVEDGSQIFTSYDDHFLVRNGTGELVAAATKLDEELGGDSVETVNLPEEVKIIGEYAFSGHFYIRELVIPGTVSSINANAFSICTGLKKVEIQAGVNSICTSAFASCVNLTDVTIGTMEVTEKNEAGEEVTRSSFRTIEQNCFGNCTGLTEIVFQGTSDEWMQVQKIGEGLLNDNMDEYGRRTYIPILCDDGKTCTEKADGTGFYVSED